MKHLSIIALATITLAACSSKTALLTKQYMQQFQYRVMDDVTSQMYFTNDITNVNGRLEFTDHEGARVSCAKCTAVENTGK